MMKLFDKILFSIAVFSFLGIVTILSSDELPKGPSKDFLPQNVSSTGQNDNGEYEIVVYTKDVDQIIEKYFETIRANPAIGEEEDRLIQSDGGFEPKEPKELTEAKGGKGENLPAPPERSSENLEFFEHTVVEGESLWRISQKYSLPVYTIISLNPDKSQKMIRPGDKIRIATIPGVNHKVKKGESLGKLSLRYKVPVEKIKKVNNLSGEIIQINQNLFIPGARPVSEYRETRKSRFIWPIKGRLTSGYGMRKHPINGNKQFHAGIDIGANYGTNIVAIADGMVLFAGDGGTYGNMVVLKHKDGFISIYAHASAILVKKGDYIKQGKVIAKVGNTGVATGSHLHLEIKKGSSRLDPLQALKEKIVVRTRI